MASSFTGGISAPFNVLLNRELNLYDATDPVACRQNIGAVAIGDLKTLTYGYGLATGTFNPDADGTISVDASATGTAGKVVKTDNNGDLTATNKLNLGGGLSFLNREAGANGTLQMRNTGTGILKLDSAGTLQLSADSTAYLQSYEAVSIGSYDGTTIQLTAADGTTARTALSVSGTRGYSGSKGLSVVGGTALDALDVSGAATFSSTIRSPLQPSWNWYKSTASTTNTIGLSPFGTAGFPLVPNWNVSVGIAGQVYPDVAGRYSVSVSGKFTGNGSVHLAAYNAGNLVLLETLVSGSGTGFPFSSTYIFDFGTGFGNYVETYYKATSR